MTATSTARQTVNPDRLFSDLATLEAGSFDRIYHHYKPALTRFASREGAADPEGVADLALFDGFRALDGMRTPTETSFRSYVYRATRSHIVTERRRSAVRTVRLDPALETPDPDVSDSTDKLWLDSLVSQLTPDQRQVIECRFFRDLSSAETAEVLGKTPNAVDQLQHRAMRRLRRLAFGGFVLALVAAGIWLLLQLGGGETSDRRPIDNPVTPHIEQQQSHTVESGESKIGAIGSEQTPRDGPSATEVSSAPTATPTAPIDVPPAGASAPEPSRRPEVAETGRDRSSYPAPRSSHSDSSEVSGAGSDAKADRKTAHLEEKWAKRAPKKAGFDSGKLEQRAGRLLQKIDRISAKAERSGTKKET